MCKRLLIGAVLFAVLATAASAQERDADADRARRYFSLGHKHQSADEFALAVAFYTEALEINPRHEGAYFSRACVLAHELHDYEKAVADLTSLLALNPTDYSALFNRGLYHEHLRKYDRAVADYTRALEPTTDFSRVGGKPDEYRAHAFHYRGRVYQWHKKDPEKAIADFTEALRLDPEIEMVHYRRGLAYHDLQQYEEAHRDFEAAYQRDPDYPNLVTAWAWQLATCPDKTYRDGAKAHELADGIIQSSKQPNPRHLDVLAATSAERGRFNDAIATIESAISHLSDKERQLKQAMESRRRLYAAGQPFRETTEPKNE